MSVNLQLFLFLLFCIFGYLLIEMIVERRQTKAALEALKSKPFPEAYRKIIERIPHYALLKESDKARLHYKILSFLYLKKFIPKYIELTDEIKVGIAFYASFMALHLPDHTFNRLRTVVVYPFSLHQEGQNIPAKGVRERILEGLNIGETMIIAWNSAKKEIFHLKSHNVVIHELAHELDFESGRFDGAPALTSRQYHTFFKIFFRHYETLRKKVSAGRFLGKYKLLGDYAATNEAEFFAVLSELYFDRPAHLYKNFPDLYNVLNDFYRLDMAQRLDQ